LYRKALTLHKNLKNIIKMAVTRLERKGKRNKAIAKNKIAHVKHLNWKPVIKQVDIEAIKAEFAAKSKEKKAESAE
jgi:hypothetical protein